MTLPSCREIRNQLLALIAVAGSVFATTTLVLEARAAKAQDPVPTALEAAGEELVGAANQPEQSTGYLNEFAKLSTRDGAAQVNWEDVNLSGHVTVPEEEVAAARSAILQDFEAR